MKIYHTETQEDYDALMIELEENGCEWRNRKKPTHSDEFKRYGKDVYIYDRCGAISISDGECFKERHSDETLIEYKAKGENMTQEEMKHKLQKNLFDVSVAIDLFARCTLSAESDLKEAESSAKKLIEKIDEYLESLKPEFKVGDIVSSEIFIDGSGIVRLEEDLTNDFSGIEGLWYIKKDCEIKDTAFGVINKKTRHATPEEIAEYEVALTFYKHGRKPFEVKDGDLLENKFGKFIALKSLFVKENFTVEGNAFLKTVEEVSEWLGADDE
ncbi:hypothetical protein LALA110947_07870 [Lactococcus laudensis]|uniref:hypothetical protein n=1 Tax=Pseudolactococcus laudensis TaxID=1494461 RepID=UPI001C5FA813|nr:hypothetical protein [Lactococcus laudensis]